MTNHSSKYESYPTNNLRGVAFKWSNRISDVMVGMLALSAVDCGWVWALIGSNQRL